MAIKGYGVQVSVSPDVSKIQEKLNKKKLSIKIKDIKISDSLLNGAQDKVQSALDKKSYEIKINKAVISQACKKDIQDQLTNLYKFEPKEDTGNANTNKRSSKIPNAIWQTQKSSLDSLYKNLNSSYNNILNYSTSHIGAEGSSERVDAEKEIATIQEEIYQKLIKINTIKNTGVELSNDEFQVLRNEITELTKKEKALGKNYLPLKDVDVDKLDKYYKTLHNWLETNSKAKGTSAGNVISDALTKLENASLAGGMSGREFKTIQQDVSQAQKNIVKLGNTGKSTFDKIHAAIEKFGGWTIITQTVSAAIRYIKNMSKVVTELDTAMTSLKKVTDETDYTYEKFAKRAEKTAISIGATVSQYITSTADYARLGYSISDAEELARVSAIYANVGDNIDENSATESIISTMKAFDLSADEAKDVVDKFNKVGNEFAIGSDGLGEVLKRSASAMHAAQNDLDETIALSTAMNTILQDPDKVGTTIKTVSMFLRAAKVEAEEAGESTEGMAQSVSKLRSDILQLTNKKVDIMIDDNTYKNTYQILQEISKVWDSLTDVDRASLLEMLGGKRNANAVAAVIENFEIAEQALLSSRNAAGSAMVENEKYLNSVAGASERLTAAQQSLTSTMLDSDVLVAWKQTSTILIESLDASMSILDGYPVSVTLATSAVLGLAAAWKAVSVAIETSSRAQEIFNGVKSVFNKQTAVITLITATVIGLLKWVKWLSEAEDRAKEKFDNSISTYSETKQQLEGINSELQTTKDRITELQAQDSLTIVEQAELNKLKETNAELVRQRELLSLDASAGLNEAQNAFSEYAQIYKTKYGVEKYEDIQGDIQRYISDLNNGLGDFYSASNYDDAVDFLNSEVNRINREMNSIKPGYTGRNDYNQAHAAMISDLNNEHLTQDEYDRLVELLSSRSRLDSLVSMQGSAWEEYVIKYKNELNTLLDAQSKLLSEFDYENLTPENQAFSDYIDDLHYSVLIASSDVDSLDSIFSTIFNSDRFKNARKGIDELNKGTEVTKKEVSELIDSNEDVKEFTDYLIRLGMIDPTNLNWEGQFANWVNAANEATSGTNDALKSLEEYSKEIDDIRAAFNNIKSVIEDYNKNNGYLSVENYQTLINLGSEYIKCLVDENGQIKLNTQAYADLAKVQMQNMLLSKIQASIDNIMNGTAAQAAELATAANYEEATSLHTLIKLKLQDAYVTARQKDSESGTTAYTAALKAQLPYWSSLISFYDEACAGLDEYGMYGYDAAEANEELTKSLQKQKDEIEKAQSSIQSLIDLVVDMIKKEKELEKEAYENQKEHIVDLIDKQKELLEAKKEEAEFNKELSEKQNTVAQNALTASLSGLDDSSAGRKSSKLAQDALNESRADLGATLSDHELDTRTKALDELKISTEEYYDGLIEEIDKYLDNERQLYEDACTMIDNDNGSLYKKLKDYVYKYTTQTEAEFEYMWTKAQEGLREYDNAHTPLWETMSTLQYKISTTEDALNDLSEAAKVSVEKSTAAIGDWSSTFQKMVEDWNKIEAGSESAPKWKYKDGKTWYFSSKTNRDEAAWDISSQLKNKLPTGYITSQIQAYATGTLSASGGISMVGENGPELKVTKPGDGIIPADVTKNLWAIGTNPLGIFESLLKRLSVIDLLGGLWSGSHLSPVVSTAGTSVSAPISISISGNASKETVDALRKLTPQIANEAAKKVMESALRYSNVPRKY